MSQGVVLWAEAEGPQAVLGVDATPLGVGFIRRVVGRALQGLPVGVSSFKLGPLAGIPVALDELALRPVDPSAVSSCL